MTTTTTTIVAGTSRVSAEVAEIRSAHNRYGAMLSIVGAITMATGGVLFSVAGADLWGLVDGDVDTTEYLTDAAASVSTLHTTHSMWIAGVLILACGGILLTRRSSDPRCIIARATYAIGAAIAIPAFLSMIALTRLAESGTDAAGLAESLAFLGARGDDIATTVILGIGPLMISLAGRNGWMPRWLVSVGIACGVAGAISLFSLFVGEAATYGFIIVPVGVIWTIAASIVTLREP